MESLLPNVLSVVLNNLEVPNTKALFALTPKPFFLRKPSKA